jgi:hypothetical protein
MKKTLAFLSALIMAAFSIPVSAISAEDFAKGDVDMDGAVTGRDAAIVSQYADGVLKTELNEEQIELADMNGDGNVDAADAALIAEIQTRELWDIDGDDCYWEIDDAYIIQRLVTLNRFREIDPTFNKEADLSEYEEWADVNLDGKIDFDDSRIVLQFVVKNKVLLPAFEDGKFYVLNPDYEACSLPDGYPTAEEGLEKAVIKYFDVDGDGVLSISDASAVLSTYANSMSGNGIYKASAEDDITDANGDGIVDISDATLILKINAYDAAGLL